ncbi:MAG: hypothetical protein JSV33_04925 [bacterium]|nr:MAG: hypothetical protein JSV33_04925 [bacterium]
MKPLKIATFFAAGFILLTLPVIAYGIDLGGARLISVTPVDGGCVSGPTGTALSVWSWDIQPEYTYTLLIDNVTECANGGTDALLNVRVNSSIPGYEYIDLVATFVSTGVYQFDFTLPENAWCTLPILYCTTPGDWSSGLFVRRQDGYPKQSHLRASTWEEGCTNPVEILGPECIEIGTEESSWGTIKMIYR